MLILFCFSCSPQRGTEQRDDGTKLLKVDLDSKGDEQNELFSHVEIIPLETQDSCFLMSLGEVVVDQENLYLFDRKQSGVFSFNAEGKFNKRLSRIGQGPGEYHHLTTIEIDRTTGHLLLLSPFGFLLEYTVNGKFVRKVTLEGKPNYHDVMRLSDGNWATWSCVREDEYGITIYDATFEKKIFETWQQDLILNLGMVHPFYQYNGQSFFSMAYGNEVYQVKSDSLVLSYSWDFGTDNLNTSLQKKYSWIKQEQERSKAILKDLENGKIPYAVSQNNQNKDYYYVALRKGTGKHSKRINVFYRKTDKRSFVFEKWNGSITFTPVYFCDDYLLVVVSPEEITNYKQILSEKEYAKLDFRKEDDNMCIAKFYFKQ